jgi:predicted O-methyltransferase YrrM
VALPRVSRNEFGVTGYTTRAYMQPGEQDVLLALIGSVRPKVMVEIGVNIGLTAQAVLRHIVSIEKYIGVDVPPGYQFEIPAQRSEWPEDPGRLVRGDSRFELIIRDGTSLSDLACDVVFIDGDHGRDAVWRDSMLAVEIVLHGGLIVWHDYNNASVEVTGVLDKLHANGRDIRHIQDTWLAYEMR